jgi:hypothetical protein
VFLFYLTLALFCFLPFLLHVIHDFSPLSSPSLLLCLRLFSFVYSSSSCFTFIYVLLFRFLLFILCRPLPAVHSLPCSVSSFGQVGVFGSPRVGNKKWVKVRAGDKRVFLCGGEGVMGFIM